MFFCMVTKSSNELCGAIVTACYHCFEALDTSKKTELQQIIFCSMLYINTVPEFPKKPIGLEPQRHILGET